MIEAFETLRLYWYIRGLILKVKSYRLTVLDYHNTVFELKKSHITNSTINENFIK